MIKHVLVCLKVGEAGDSRLAAARVIASSFGTQAAKYG